MSDKTVAKQAPPKGGITRTPLTKKRRAAIEAYVWIRCKNKMHVTAIIDQTLRTERLRPEELYQRLHKHGYRYVARMELWVVRTKGKKHE